MESESGPQLISFTLMFCHPERRSPRRAPQQQVFVAGVTGRPSRKICRENSTLLSPQRCHPEVRSGSPRMGLCSWGARATKDPRLYFHASGWNTLPCPTALKIAPCYHHSAVILRSTATKDPRLHFHVSGRNTLPRPTALKIDGEPPVTATRVAKFPEGTQENSPGWTLNLSATKVKGESWDCILHDLSAPAGRSNTSAFSWSPGERLSILIAVALLIAPELSFAVSQRLAKVQHAS
jgi:hypothetical protein